jgi:CHASE1-domain containing sensor protein
MTRPYTATERNDSKLYRPEWTAADGDYIFANSSRWPQQSTGVSRPIHIGNAVWEVYLEPEGGWRPSWEQGAIAAVVLGSVILSLLVATIMALWAQQQQLLGDVLVRVLSAGGG